LVFNFFSSKAAFCPRLHSLFILNEDDDDDDDGAIKSEERERF